MATPYRAVQSPACRGLDREEPGAQEGLQSHTRHQQSAQSCPEAPRWEYRCHKLIRGFSKPQLPDEASCLEIPEACKHEVHMLAGQTNALSFQITHLINTHSLNVWPWIHRHVGWIGCPITGGNGGWLQVCAPVHLTRASRNWKMAVIEGIAVRPRSIKSFSRMASVIGPLQCTVTLWCL